MLNVSRPNPHPDPRLNSPSLLLPPSPPPPPPPITTITTSAITAAIATAFNLSKVSFWDDTVEPFKPKFYVDLGLLKTMHSYLEDEI